MLSEFAVACVQTDIHVVPDRVTPQEAEVTIRRNLQRHLQMIDYLFMDSRYGGPRIAVFSEFSLVGTPESRTYEGYLNRLVEIPGWVTEEYGRKCKEYGIFICSNTYETDPEWPGYVFNTAFLIDPKGDVILRYRKNNSSQGGQARTVNSGDVYTRYVEKYGGPEALFPVVDTELGKMAIMICADNNYPEVARCLALRGAEIILHPTAEATGGPSRLGWDLMKQTHCYQNALYMISTNNGRTLESLRPEFRQSGHSKIIDYRGQIMSEAEVQGECVITATLDMEALRRHRARGAAPLFTSRYETYIPIFEKYKTWPLNTFIDEPNTSPKLPAETRKAVLKRMHEEGRLIPPQHATQNGAHEAPERSLA